MGVTNLDILKLKGLKVDVTLTPINTPDAMDEDSAIALANANKAKINEIIAAIVGR
jgi:hypothetical protein